MGLFDRDEAGIKAFNDFGKNFMLFNGNADIKKHKNERAFAVLLPVPEGKETFAKSKNLPLEHYFSEEVKRKRTNNGFGLKFENIHKRQKLFELCKELLDKPHFQKITGGKDVFAKEIVPTLPKEEFENFKILFETIQEI